MKKTTLFLIPIFTLILLISSCNNINHTKTIEELMQQQENCWNKGDLACFMTAYWKSDSLTFIGKSGVNYGWKSTLNNYKESYKDQSEMGKLTFNNISITQLSSDFIYVVGKWNLNRVAPLTNLNGHYTLVWKKIDGKWLIISDHSS